QAPATRGEPRSQPAPAAAVRDGGLASRFAAFFDCITRNVFAESILILPTPSGHFRQISRFSGPKYLAPSHLTAGCASPLPPPPVAPEPPAVQPPEYIPVVRYGRYTLVELAPTATQHDLLLQVVDVVVPDTLHAS